MEDSLLVLYILTPILLLIIGAALFLFLRKNHISKNLKLCIEDSLKIEPFLKKMSIKKLSLYSGLVEKISSHKDISLPKKLGMDFFWIARLERRATSANLKRVLRFCADNGIYSAFKSSLKKEKLRPIFLNFIQEQKFEVLLNALAKKAYLLEFDGKSASELLNQHIEQIADLADSSSPEDRWFSFRIMATLEDSHPFGAVKWKAFKDHSFEIRRMIIEEVNSDDRESLFKELFSSLVNDTDRVIRERVKELIKENYSDLYSFDFKELSIVQQIHFVENLSTELEFDKKIAIDNLLTENMELRYSIVEYLNRTDALKKLILSVDINDSSRLDYSVSLLNSALEVGGDKVFEVLDSTLNSGSLMSAAILLNSLGDRKYIVKLAKAVFSLREKGDLNPLTSELYKKTLDAIQKRGDEKSYLALKDEILANRYEFELSALLLNHIPSRGDTVFSDMVFSLLYNPKVTNRDALLKALHKLPKESVVAEMVSILKSDRETPFEVRLNAIEYFKKYNIELCFQYMIENLDFFPGDSIKEAVNQLYVYSSKLFKASVENVIKTEDNRSITALLKVLYLTADSYYIDLIKSELENSSAQIRKAAILGLYNFKYSSLFESITPLLSDADKEVRLLAAEIMASSAVDSEIAKIRSILLDENELKIVKKAIIVGLGKSRNESSCEILLEGVDANPLLFDYILIALLTKETKEVAARLVSLYEIVGESARKVVVQYFRNKGILEQEILLDFIADEKHGNLKKFSREILFKTGFVDNAIHKLRHKSSEVRISALNKLIVIDTFDAHKGIVLAARDNNKAIRKVAFDRFEGMLSKEKGAIEMLKDDSSRMVQKNINWIINKIEKSGGVK